MAHTHARQTRNSDRAHNRARDANPGRDSDDARHRLSPSRHRAADRRILAALLLLTLLLYGRGLTTIGPWYGDAANHLLNGIFVHDALLNPGPAASAPMDFALDYYSHFPALSLGYYPPVLPIIEAAVMLLVGVSTAAGQATMLIMALLLTTAQFAWLRQSYDSVHAALGTVLVISTPLLLFWGQCISLELPALAWIVLAAWAFDRVVATEQRHWRYAIVFALALSLAIWTKQHAVFMVPVFIIALFVQRRGRILRGAPGIVGAAMIAVAVLGVLAMTAKFGGNAMAQAGAADIEHLGKRLDPSFWTYYPGKLPDILGWPLLVVAAGGAILIVARRARRAAVPIFWIILYYISHSYPYPHAIRYACLWVPPLLLLATHALASIPGSMPSFAGRRWRLSTVVLALFAALSVAQGLRTNVARLPSALESATRIVAQRLGRYACLAQVSDYQPRAAAYFRIAVEDRLADGDATLDTCGRLFRAEQVLQPRDGQWPDARAMNELLRQWNVTMLLLEFGGEEPPSESSSARERLLAAVARSGDFREIQRWRLKVPIDDTWRKLAHSMWEPPPRHNRTMVLYERTEPLPWNANGGPTIRPARAALEIAVQDSPK